MYTNTNCNNWNRLMEHRGHLERIALAKKMIDTKTPNQPKFFKEAACKKAMKKEFNRQIDIDNNLLYKKMYELKIHHSPYAKELNIIQPCPAFESLSYNKWRKQKVIERENSRFKKRLLSAKTTYRTQKYLDDYKYSEYLEKNISKGAKQRNPNLNFTTYNGFKNNLKYNIENCLDGQSSSMGFSSTTGSRSFNNNFRPSSSKTYNTINNNFRPSSSKTNNTFNNNFRPSSSKTNNTFNNNFRPSSSKSYTIQREIDYSGNYNNEEDIRNNNAHTTDAYTHS